MSAQLELQAPLYMRAQGINQIDSTRVKFKIHLDPPRSEFR